MPDASAARHGIDFEEKIVTSTDTIKTITNFAKVTSQDPENERRISLLQHGIGQAASHFINLDHSDLILMCLFINLFAFCTTVIVSGSFLIKSANSFSFSTAKQL